MIQVSLQDVCRELDGSAAEDGERLARLALPPLSIDSRTLAPGDCFVAIAGPRFDGHRFIAEALRKGAAAVVHSGAVENLPRSSQATLIRVADTTEALKKLGRLVRRRWGGRLVAITGSMGKTTTRRFAAGLLRTRFQTMESPENFNNQYGVPLALSGLTGAHQRAVLELGMNHSGEIRELCSICEPDAAALTNVGPVHLEFFRDVDEIAAAKGEILETLEKGPLTYNADDHRVAALARRFRGRKISFGLREAADVGVADFRFDGLESAFYKLRIFGRTFSCQSPFAGVHFLYNVAAAAAIASGEGMEPPETAAAVSVLEAPAKRGGVTRLRISEDAGRLTILDDSYNSNPEALKSMLETVAAVESFRRRILALGEMLELGADSERFHREAGRQAARAEPDLLWTVGERAAAIREGAVAEGFPAAKARHFDDSEAAGVALAGELRHGDLLAVKGSHGANMDRLIDRVREIRGRSTA